jgi:hypothetical protein
MTTALRLSLLVLLAAPGAAQAADHGLYLGLAISDVSPDYAAQQIAYPASGILAADDTPSHVTGDGVDAIGSPGFKAVVGYRFVDVLAIEADYLDLGTDSEAAVYFCVDQPCPNRIRAKTSSFSLSALFLWPIDRFDVFARLGFSHWETDVETLNSDGSLFWSQDLSGSDAKYGLGGQVHLDKVTVRLEYERLNFGGDAADTWSIGVAWRF